MLGSTISLQVSHMLCTCLMTLNIAGVEGLAFRMTYQTLFGFKFERVHETVQPLHYHPWQCLCVPLNTCCVILVAYFPRSCP